MAHIPLGSTSLTSHSSVSLGRLITGSPEVRACQLIPVKPNTALDRDARKRATSVYLVQRAVPMLPPQLSEELCSLRPNEERLAFSASFTIDQNGTVVKTDFARTIIK